MAENHTLKTNGVLARCGPTEDMFDETVAYIRRFFPHTEWFPLVGIVCGSGLGDLVKSLQPLSYSNNETPSASVGHEKQQRLLELDYANIPHFARSTVEGHQGRLVFGSIGKMPAVCMVGRFHFYEGWTLQQTTYPIRIMALLGVQVLILTNAAGSLCPEQHPVGNVMILKDHLNFLGLGGQNPLIGPNLSAYGPRFPATSDAYDRELRKTAAAAGRQVFGEDPLIREGVYCCLAGPSYETRAEARFLRLAGGDAVGMSTVPEVLVARHMGVRVLALSLITNLVLMEDDSEHDANLANGKPAVEKATHEEVLRTSQLRAHQMVQLVTTIVHSLKLAC